MAITIKRVFGFELQGLEECSVASASVENVADAPSGVLGTRSLRFITTAGANARFDHTEYQGSVNTNAKAIGFWIKCVAYGTGITSATICDGYDDGDNRIFRLYLNTDGTMEVQDANLSSATNLSVSGVDPTDGGWHFIEFWFQQTGNDGWALHIDGQEAGTGTGKDFLANNGFQYMRAICPRVDSDYRWFAVYIAEADSAADFLGSLDVFPCTGSTSATTGGDTLDAGTWQNTQEIPPGDTNIASYNYSAGTPSNADYYPDGETFSLTNLSGTFEDVNEDPDSPDANWLTAPGSNNDTAVVASFPTPSNNPTGTQTFRAWVRKTNQSTDPTAVVEIYEGATLRATVVSSTTISSTTGQMLSGTWNASVLGTADGSDVRIRVAGTVGGGAPSNRGSVEIGALEWQAQLAGTPPAESGWIQADTGSLAGPNGVSGVGTIAGMLTYIRTAYSGSGSVLTHSLERGNSGDGVTSLSLGDATASYADFFDFTESATIVPTDTEYARGGFGHPAGTEVDIDCAEVICMVGHVPPSTGGGTLDAVSGSYSLTGAAATLKAALDAPVDAGSYAYTGSAAEFRLGVSIPAEAGSYATTGSDASLTTARVQNAESGAYAVTGSDADFQVAWVVEAEAGAFTLTGSDANFTTGTNLQAEAGSYDLTGSDANFLLDSVLLSEAGAYSYTGSDAGLYASLILSVDAGAYSYTGADAELQTGNALSANAGAYSYTGSAAELLVDYVVEVEAGSYSYTGASANLDAANQYSLEAASGAYTIYPAGDEFFDNVTLLLHCDGTDGSTSFPDSSNSNNIVTANGNAQVDTANKKYGTGSALFDGVSDWLSMPYDLSDFQWWINDFTIEAWVYADDWSGWTGDAGNTYSAMCGNTQIAGTFVKWMFGPRFDGLVTFFYDSDTGHVVTADAGTALSTSEWHHIAMTQSGGKITLWADGKFVGNTSIIGSPSHSSSVPLTVGLTNVYSIDGWVDDLRITKALRYSTDFEPPVRQHPDIADNVLFKRNIILSAGAGSYSYAGSDNEFVNGWVMTAEADSYAVTGSAADFPLGFALQAEAGSYDLTGSDIALNRDLIVQVEDGSYSLTGSDVAAQRALIVQANAGSYAYTESDANLNKGIVFEADAGSYIATGSDIDLPKSSVLGAVAGSYAYTGAAATLSYQFEGALAANPGSYSITGADAALQLTLILNAESGTYAVTGADATLTVPTSATLAANSGAYVTAGANAQFSVGGSSTRRIIMIG